jgi:hypothetical protein
MSSIEMVPANRFYPVGLGGFLSSPEMPETQLARSSPLSAVRLLNKMSERKLYSECATVAGSVVNNYFHYSSTRNVDSISGVDIDVRNRRSFFFDRDQGLSVRIRFRRER